MMCSEVDHSHQIDDTYEIFSTAYRNLDIGLMNDIYDEDAYYLSPGDGIRKGRQSFINGFTNMFKQAKIDIDKLSIEFDIIERKVHDQTAIDIGLYKMTRYSADSISSFIGKFITVLEYKPDGKWKFVADGYSSAPDSSWTKN